MNRKTSIILLLVGFLIASSCNRYNDLALITIQEAETLVDSLPRTALIKLEAIDNHSKLSEENLTRYNIVLLKSTIRLGRTLSSDSVLLQPITYFQKNNDSLKLSKTYYNSAVYYYSIKDYRTAIKYFNLASNNLPKSRDALLDSKYSSMLGYSYNHLNDMEKAIEYHKKSLFYAEKVGSTETILSALRALSWAYKDSHDFKEAISTLLRALKIAQDEGMTNIEIDILNTISSIYESNNNIEMAIEYKTQAATLDKTREDIASNKINLALLYMKQNKLDSALSFAESAIKGNDLYVASMAYSLMGKINRMKGKRIEELNNIKNENRLFNLISDNISTEILQQKYQDEKLKNENNQLKVQQQKHKIWILSTLFLVFILIVVFTFVWRENRRKIEKIKLINKEALLKKENLLLKQQKEISELREKELVLRESLFKRINMFKKFPSLKKDEDSSTIHNKIQLDEKDWNELIRGIRDAYPRFIEQLTKLAPTLTEDDIRFCCLLKINVDLQDLSDIYCVSKSAITKRKYRLKTDKFKVSDKDITLNSLILDL